jgi:PTS system galactitol-specific IIC component
MNLLQLVLDLGASVILPIIIFIMGLLLGMKVGKAFRSAMMIGIGFIGINIFIGFFIGAIAPATNAFVQNTGIQLDVLDVGFAAATVTGWGSPISLYFIPLGLAVNIALLVLRSTRTVDVDLWNYWIWGLAGALVYAFTGNLLLAFVAFVIVEVSTLILADITAKKVQEQFDLPGVSIPHADAVPWVIVGYPIIWLLDRIPFLNKIEADPQIVRKKLGVLGEPVFIGFVLGILLGILGRQSLSEIIQLAFKVPASLVIFPILIRLIREGLLPVAETLRGFLQKRFPGKEYYIGLDAAVIVGDEVVLSTAVLLIPILLLIAPILPGNRVLPLANLSSLFFHTCVVTAIANRNYIKSLIAQIGVFIVGFYICTSLAPLFTQTAIQSGFVMPEDTTLITAFVSGFAPNNWFATVLLNFLSRFGTVIAAAGGILIILAIAFGGWLFNRKTVTES